jgi:hypothetical protein
MTSSGFVTTTILAASLYFFMLCATSCINETLSVSRSVLDAAIFPLLAAITIILEFLINS